MKATITVEMDNAAFEDHPARELARILQKLADSVRGRGGVASLEAGDVVNLRDVNGNTVGRFEVSE